MKENFPNLAKERDFQEVQEAQRVPKKWDPRKHTPRHIIITLPEIKDKESSFLRFYLFIFRQKGREGETHQCVVASHMASTGDLARNPGMCPDWESNQ